MLENIYVLNHSVIKFDRDIIIYFDPFQIKRDFKDADMIFITHSHYDHFSKEDIEKVLKHDTIIVAPFDLREALLDIVSSGQIYLVKPYENYEIEGISFKTVPAYNIDKPFHPKENNWVGYIIDINGYKYYIAGDTDIVEENKDIKCDVAFLPVGGIYTMDAVKAAEFANEIVPKIAVPIHYGSVVGSIDDALRFVKNLDKNVKGKILMK